MSQSDWRIAVGMAAMCLILAAGCSQMVDLNQVSPSAAEAVKKAFPAASVDETVAESDGALKLYEVELTEGQREVTVTVSAEGTIIEVETVMALNEVPKPVEEAVTKAVGDGKLDKLEKVEHRGKVRAGKIEMLDTLDVLYEAKYWRWWIRHEVQWNPDGSIRKGS
jgi:hypothetical protein